MTRVRGARRARGERGAVAVEAALITPVLILMIFGMVEFALVLRDHVSVSSSVRVGARIASANPGGGPGTCVTASGGPTTCLSKNTPAFAYQAAAAIQLAGTAMPKDAIDYVLVYKANDKGYPGANGSTTMPASTAACAALGNCVAYTWQASSDVFRYAAGNWDSTTVNACPSTADAVGVYLHTTHGFITKMFGSSIGLDDRAVMRFEPLPTSTCAAGAHQ